MKTLAITLGDINGIGPEVALKAACAASWPADVRLVLIGDAAVVRRQARALHCEPPPAWSPGAKSAPAKVLVWDPTPGVRLRPAPGTVRVDAAQSAIDWIHAAVRGCLGRVFDGMITAPICKEGLLKAGFDIPGHTEFLARLTHARRFAMMLMGGGLRVVLATRHVPLSAVASTITTANICEAAELTCEALPWLGVRKGTIAVCGLNPHAGDGGAIGSEEKTIIAPAIRRLKRAGHPVDGPVPADVVFHHALKGRYAAVVCMYHDQGLGPLKMLAFDKGVNVTLGLPIVRTSPDHGTAFDIAGKGIADPSSMVEAIRLAYAVSKRRNPWR